MCECGGITVNVEWADIMVTDDDRCDVLYILSSLVVRFYPPSLPRPSVCRSGGRTMNYSTRNGHDSGCYLEQDGRISRR